MMQPFQILSQKRVLDEPYCKIDQQRVVLPDGTEGDWWLRAEPDVAVIIPVMSDGRVVLQRNYKHGAGQIIVEFCAGCVDPSETPEQAAVRELAEELGLSAQELTHLQTCYARPTGSGCRLFFFLATGCAFDVPQQLDAAEQIEPLIVHNLRAAQMQLENPKTQTSCTTLAALHCAIAHDGTKKSQD